VWVRVGAEWDCGLKFGDKVWVRVGAEWDCGLKFGDKVWVRVGAEWDCGLKFEGWHKTAKCDRSNWVTLTIGSIRSTWILSCWSRTAGGRGGCQRRGAPNLVE
jgi:hypothetical protein